MLNLNPPVKGGSGVRVGLGTSPHLIPRAFVEIGHLSQKLPAVAMLQIQQNVEIPVQVIGEIADFTP
jgi:hypothetical protein